MKRFVLLYSLLVLMSCQSSTEQASSATSTFNYFDLQKFIAEQISTIPNDIKFRKTIILNNQKEEQIINSLNLQEDLNIFKSAAIDKKNIDKYTIDTIFHPDQSVKKINFQTSNKDIATKKLEITYFKDKVKEIKIHQKRNSFFSDNSKTLHYSTNKGFSIKDESKTSFLDPQTLTVDVEFVY